jgi:hypothetical protein
VNVRQLLDKLAGILNDERRVQMEKYKSLKKILKALRHHKTALEETLEETRDPEKREEIESRLKVITAQRHKGLKILKKIHKERNEST